VETGGDEPPRYKGTIQPPLGGGRPPRSILHEPVGPAKGLLVIIVVLVAFMLVSAFVTWLAIIASLAGLMLIIGPLIGLAFMIVIALIIPYFVGALIDGWGWLLPPAVAAFSLLVAVPYSLYSVYGDVYMWSSRKLNTPFWALFLIIPLSAAAGYFGMRRAKHEGWRRIRLSNPLLGVGVAVAIVLLVATAAPWWVDAVKGNTTHTASYPKFSLEMEVPKGWTSARRKENPGGGPLGDEAWGHVRETALSGCGDYPAGLNVHIYRKMPFTGEEFEEFKTTEDIYQRLKESVEAGLYDKLTYREVAFIRPPGQEDLVRKQGRVIPPDLSYRWEEERVVDGVPALSMWVERTLEEGHPSSDSSKRDYVDPAQETVFVYRSPYLYAFEFGEGYREEAGADPVMFKELLASLRFMSPESAARLSKGETPVYAWKELKRFDDITLSDVFALDRGHVWFTGGTEQAGTVEFFDGASWSRQLSVPELLMSVCATAPDDAWAVGEEGGVYHFDGASWSKHSTVEGRRLYAVFALDPNNVWLGGSKDEGIGGDGAISFFDGSTWTEQVLPSMIQEIDGVDANHLWAATDTVFYFFNGTSWLAQGFPDGKGMHGGVASISAADPRHVWGIAVPDEVYFFDGESWELENPEGVYFEDPRAVCAFDSSHVWLSGDGPIWFFDGSRWSSQHGSAVMLSGTRALSAADAGLVFGINRSCVLVGEGE